MAEFRALCAELLKALEIQLDDLRLSNLDDVRFIDQVCKKARTALAQPEPQGPGDEEDKVCPYVVTAGEGTSYCKLGVQTADLLAKLTG